MLEFGDDNGDKSKNKKQEPETKKRQKKDPLSPPHHTTPKCQAVPVTYLC